MRVKIDVGPFAGGIGFRRSRRHSETSGHAAACSFHAVPANLRGWGWAELRALPGRYALRDWLAPFGPERISQPCQT